MKIIQDDVVIAKPIVLKIAEIPVFGIPLAIFPHQGGKRHSGWIMPAYGESKSRGPIY
jgi:lipopolysaccharide assembly outer membrane protein LptD (OstA)